jgi:hypothetical protein
VLQPGDRLRLAGERVDVEAGNALVQAYQTQAVVLEANVIGFSALDERYGSAFAEKITDIFERLEDQVLLSRGCPLRNRGDGLKAAWGLWALDDRRHSPVDAAFNFAHLARSTIQEQIFKFSREADSADLRVGLALGHVDYSKTDRFDVTGRPAALATGLAELNRVFGTNIILDQRCRAELRIVDHVRELDTVRFADLGKTTVWGFDDRSRIRQVASTAVTDEQALLAPLKYLTMYAEALEAYRSGRFDEAFKLFGETYKSYRDRPARAMRDRCAQIGERAADWEGVWELG